MGWRCERQGEEEERNKIQAETKEHERNQERYLTHTRTHTDGQTDEPPPPPPSTNTEERVTDDKKQYSTTTSHTKRYADVQTERAQKLRHTTRQQSTEKESAKVLGTRAHTTNLAHTCGFVSRSNAGKRDCANT